MNEPRVNVDHLYHRPTYRVVGLLTEQSEIPASPVISHRPGLIRRDLWSPSLLG